MSQASLSPTNDSKMNTATATGTRLDDPANGVTRRTGGEDGGVVKKTDQLNGNSNTETTISTPEKPKRSYRSSKYRHVEAIHSESQPSCLSHDTTETPSFLGFRNLMVIVLVVGNLRLVIENIQKVAGCLGFHQRFPYIH